MILEAALIFFMQMRTGGMTPPEYASNLVCSVYEYKTIITHTTFAGTRTIEKVTPFNSKWIDQIEKASKGELEYSMGPMDIGLILFFAYQNGERVILSGVSDEGNIIENLASETPELKGTIRALCDI